MPKSTKYMFWNMLLQIVKKNSLCISVLGTCSVFYHSVKLIISISAFCKTISHILEPVLSKQLPDTGNFVEEVLRKKMSLFLVLYTSIEATSNKGVVGFNCGKVV